MPISRVSPGEERRLKLLTKDEARPALEVRPQDKDERTAEERQQQHEAEIVFCPVHVSQFQGKRRNVCAATQDRACGSCHSWLNEFLKAPWLNASQPPNQNYADDNDKPNGELHLASIPFDASEAKVP
jgi:hypothetical protein